MPEGKKAPAPVQDSYTAKTHLQHQVREIGTVVATAAPAEAADYMVPSEARPEIITYEKLTEAIKASGRAYNTEMIEKAYRMANEAHKDARRRSGEPYICHPLAVARLVLDLGMDTESIAAALLHDVVEDTPITIEEVKSAFGAEVALLVDGVTKLTKIQFSSIEEQQAENLRKMLLAMSQDVRVMIIKLCDRLHNMRTGDAWPEQKRRDKARETMEVYAPIANRLGILNIKEELEDRSLHYLDPVGYEEISRLLSERSGEEFLAGVSALIEKRLEESGIHGATMKRRVKSIYGIYRKMFVQNKSFDEIYDVYAVRIILDTITECYTTRACTPPSSGTRASPSRCRSAPARWTNRPSTASPPTGSTRRAWAATTSWTTGWPGCASCWKTSGSRRIRATCCTTSRATFCPRKSLPLPPRGTSSTCRPGPPASTLPRDWLKIVKTSEAKSKIRNWFKKMRRDENIAEGRDALARELRREGILIPDDKLDEFVGGCCRRMRQNSAEDLYAAIGYGGITIANCMPKFKEEYQKLKAAEAPAPELPKVDLRKVHSTDGVVVEGFDNTPIKFAKCCNPLPGDPIVGFITRGFGVSIHKASCTNAVSSMKDPANAPRWVKAYWADSVKESYKAGLEILALDRNDLLKDVLNALSDMRVPIYNMNARQVENYGIVNLTIGINNTDHVDRVVARLGKIRDVLKVTRS